MKNVAIYRRIVALVLLVGTHVCIDHLRADDAHHAVTASVDAETEAASEFVAQL